jgi:sugar lactone lactonase YvrE
MTSLLVGDGLIFPEGPRWHDGALYLSDQHAHKVLRITLDGDVTTLTEFGDMPSGLGFLPDGSLLVALMRSAHIRRLDLTTLRHELYSDLSMTGTRCLINDMVVDQEGRAYVGCRTGQYAHPPEGPGWITRVDPGGSPSIAATDLMGPNGMIVSNGALLVAETWESRITQFDMDPHGVLGSRRAFAVLPDGLRPDGICLDWEGSVWTGAIGAWIRVSADGAITERRAPAPGFSAVACVHGGGQRQLLFLVSSAFKREGLRALAQGRQDSESGSVGRVEFVSVATSGAGIP